EKRTLEHEKRTLEHEKCTHELAQEVTAVKLEQIEYVTLLKENTDTTVEMKATVDQMYEVFQSWQGAFKVLEWIGKVAKPVAAIVGMVTALVVAWKTGA
ncbi:UNVERIFIED_CONTAM: hypothetical protein IGO34_27230, partial [Salmonella enterica subsp. enterica serovar Weltevreden]